MKKRILSIVLAVVMLVSVLAVGASAALYTDTEGHWGEPAINLGTERGIVWGFGDGTFRPDDVMTRAQISQIFTNLLKLSKTADLSKFVDLKPGWWYHHVLSTAHQRGIILGTSPSTMDPDGPLTREQLMTMFCRALGLEPQDTMNATYTDADQTASWAIGYVNTLVNKGYIKGLNNVGYKDDLAEGILAPKMILTRAMLMQLLDNAIGQYITEPGTYHIEKSDLPDGQQKIVLVVSDGVTITGDTENVIIASPEKTEEDKDRPTVTISGSKVSEAITVVTDTNVRVVDGANATTVKTTGTATGAVVEVDKTSTVDSVKVGADTTVQGDGTVKEVVVSADEPVTAQVDTTKSVPKVTLETDGAAITGSSKIGEVEVKADDTNVNVDNTTVKVDPDTNGTKVNGTDVSADKTAQVVNGKVVEPTTGGGSSARLLYTLTLTIKNEDKSKSVTGTRPQYVDNDVLEQAMYILVENFNIDNNAEWTDENSKLANVFGYKTAGDFSASAEFFMLKDMINAYLDVKNGTSTATTPWATYVANSTEAADANNEDTSVLLKTVYATGVNAKFSELKKGSWDITYTLTTEKDGTTPLDPARTYTVTLTIS
ncbi:MAG: S-layer homology domain-containing protein [Oscillospiraceae bacterium]|nr:S-layer homology domain-containing protein [Oscillospiraceae bacterium]